MDFAFIDIDSCGNGFVVSVVNSKCYKFLNEKMTRDEGASACRNLNATLAMPKTQVESKELARIAFSNDSDAFASERDFWLGARRDKSTTNCNRTITCWKWDDGSQVEYINWAANQPNGDDKHTPQNCLEMNRQQRLY